MHIHAGKTEVRRMPKNNPSVYTKAAGSKKAFTKKTKKKKTSKKSKGGRGR